MKLIVGLGNPGAEYEHTRHNAGFEVIEVLSKRHQIPVAKRNHKAVYGEGYISGERILLVRPMTYMNLSGEAVSSLSHFYKISPQDIIVIVDDVALPVGRIRLRFKGSAGGQNGLDSILRLMNTQEIPRIRIGVGAAGTKGLVGHVLSRFRKEEIPLMQEAFERAADAVEYALQAGFENAMNKFNISDKRPSEAASPETSG